jgi:predicted patatin/cPLA2 family phospholipase
MFRSQTRQSLLWPRSAARTTVSLGRSTAHRPPVRFGALAARSARAAAALLAPLLFVGCGALLRNPTPPELAATAAVPDMPDVRSWVGRRDTAMQDDLIVSFSQESREDFPVGPFGQVGYPVLLLSGGGANGAFGAGLLNGWTRSGTRPVFKIVTGVSTGALMAPFAFAGPDYDAALRDLYTTTSTRDIFARGSLLALLSQVLAGEALADTGPLASMIARHVDEAMIDRVAAAHRNGRRLYIGTADLDSQRFVVWNMGRIAASSRPERLALFRKVMLASASIPVAFPPVFFDVEVDGQRFDEMHVDGGVGAMVFFSAGVFSTSAARRSAGGPAGYEDLFVIHNGQLRPPTASPTPRTVRGISRRVLEASGRAAVVGDLFRIYTLVLEERARFRWVTIGTDINIAGDEFFDPVVMARLYEQGLEVGLNGRWATRPPGLEDPPWERPPSADGTTAPQRLQ